MMTDAEKLTAAIERLAKAIEDETVIRAQWLAKDIEQMARTHAHNETHEALLREHVEATQRQNALHERAVRVQEAGTLGSVMSRGTLS